MNTYPSLRCGRAATRARALYALSRAAARAHSTKVIYCCGSCAMKSYRTACPFFTVQQPSARSRARTHAAQTPTEGCVWIEVIVLDVICARTWRETQTHQFEKSAPNSGAAASAWFSRPLSPLWAQTSVRTASKSGRSLTTQTKNPPASSLLV